MPLRSAGTALCERLGIELPIVQAPMAGGWTTPALVAAVANAGGLGMLAGARITAQRLREQIDAVRAATDRPFGVNFLLAPPDPAPHDAAAMQHVLDEGRAKLGLPRGLATLPALPPSQLQQQIDLVCAAHIPIVSFAMGDPAPFVGRLKEAGCFVIAMATTVDDALRLEAAGIDAVVAQGAEAGGHRSTLDAPGEDLSLIGTFALVPQVVDAVKVPVIAAGGVMDGRGVLAALALGAQAAQLGTRFLLARESGASGAYRRRLLEAVETDTVVTRALTGRPARALRNALVRAVERAGTPPLPWPYQAMAADDLWRAATGRDDADWAPLFAGQGLRLARSEAPASEIVTTLRDELASALERVATYRPAPS
jgi:nitronate monooxygenase